MLTILVISALCVGILALSVGVYAVKHARPVIQQEATAQISGFKCPYCRVDVTGVRDLDLINHSLCITRSEEELDRVRAEAKKAVVPDEYFVDARRSRWPDYTSVPTDLRKKVSYVSGGTYEIYVAKVYRNGEIIDTQYAKDMNSAEAFAERSITIDKHRRKSKSKA